MRRFLIPFRLFGLLFRVAPPFPAASLAPSIALLAIYIVLVLAAAPVDMAVTLAVFAALAVRAWPRLRPTAERVARITDGATPYIAIGVFFGLPMALILWQMDTRWSQHMVTFAPLAVALVRFLDIARGDYTAARMTWPDLEYAWPQLTRAMLLSALAFALLNETLMRIASLEAWIAWFALMPILSHYVTSALTLTVLLDLDADA